MAIAKLYDITSTITSMRRLTLIFFLLVAGTNLLAQSANVALNADYYHLIERNEIKQKSFSTYFYSNFKPFSRQTIAQFLADLPADLDRSPADRFNRRYLNMDSWEFTGYDSVRSEHPVWGSIYKYPADFLAYHGDHFDIHVNPVLNLAVGQDDLSGSTPFINTRGAEIRGIIDNKVGFYTYIGENQAVFPGYVQAWNRRFQVVPNEGFWKRYGDHGFDYLSVRGYFNFAATRHIGLQFGYDKNFVGSGFRSMLLSDFAPAYPFLKINAQVWKLQYQVMYAQPTADQFFVADGSGSLGTREFPKKFMTMHQLSINVTDNFTIGIFESIIFNKEDSLANSRFELNYLNPIIFLTAIEQQTGSADNSLLGFDARWNIAGKYQLYGQFLIDEFVVSEVFSGDGWWSNKYATQLGFKYIDVANVSNLDLQMEYNFARPYTYAHLGMETNYSHYRQSLAHPFGANFREFVGIVRYQPLPRLFLKGQLIVAQYGEDDNGSNWGKNILLSYDTYEQEYGNEVGQGIATDLLFGQFTASYMWKHNFFTDLTFSYRDEQNVLGTGTDPTTFVQLSLRLNAPQINHHF